MPLGPDFRPPNDSQTKICRRIWTEVHGRREPKSHFLVVYGGTLEWYRSLSQFTLYSGFGPHLGPFVMNSLGQGAWVIVRSREYGVQNPGIFTHEVQCIF